MILFHGILRGSYKSQIITGMDHVQGLVTRQLRDAVLALACHHPGIIGNDLGAGGVRPADFYKGFHA